MQAGGLSDRYECGVPRFPHRIGRVVRFPLGFLGPNHPETCQRVFLVDCKRFIYRHFQWRRRTLGFGREDVNMPTSGFSTRRSSTSEFHARRADRPGNDGYEFP